MHWVGFFFSLGSLLAYQKYLCRFENFVIIPTQEKILYLIYFAQCLSPRFFKPLVLLPFLISCLLWLFYTSYYVFSVSILQHVEEIQKGIMHYTVIRICIACVRRTGQNQGCFRKQSYFPTCVSFCCAKCFPLSKNLEIDCMKFLSILEFF